MSPLRDQQVLVPVIERMASATVVCAGDVMLDSFVHGEVNRISPEAPIPVLRIKRCQSMLGGAGNAVRNLVALGCPVRFFPLQAMTPKPETYGLCFRSCRATVLFSSASRPGRRQ
jgi:bifunctional ADP-heptose synthase (sugar kinase/adenylyltransferase)